MRSFVPVKVKKEIVDFVTDEGPRAGTTAESLAKLKCRLVKRVDLLQQVTPW